MAQKLIPQSCSDRAGWTGGSAGDDQNTTGLPSYCNSDNTSTYITGDVGMDSAPVGPAIFSIGSPPSVDDPETGEDHFIKYTAFAQQGGFMGPPGLTIALYQSTTLIRTVTNSSISTSQFTEYESELSEAQANSITDYDDLILRVTNNGTDMGDSIKIAYMYLEVPDAEVAGSPFIIFVE